MIYTRCINCGSPLPELPQHEGIRRYLVPAVVLLVVFIVLVLVIVPAIEYSMAGGHVLSTALGAITATPTPLPQYPLNQPVRIGDLQVTVTDARAGETQFNGNRFYTVTLTFQNYNASDTYTIAAADFALTDGKGIYYTPSGGIQSKPSYDLSPDTTGIASVVYIVPQNSDKMQLLYTFPSATAAAPDKGRTQVSFIL